MREVGWIDDDGAIHDWEEWNGKLVARQRADRDRKRRARAGPSAGQSVDASAGQGADRPHPKVRNDTVRNDTDNFSRQAGEVVASQPARASERPPVADCVSPPYRDDLDALLASLAEPQPWAAEIRAAATGLHGPPLTPDQLGLAVRDYRASGAVQWDATKRPSLRHFRGFLRRAAHPEGGSHPDEWVPPEERPGTPEYRRTHA